MKKIGFNSILLLLIFYIFACGNDTAKKKIVVTGRLIDSTNNRVWSGYDITARTLAGLGDEELGSASIDKYGNFQLTYYTTEFNKGGNLRLVVYPYIIAQYKLDNLPFAENWHKDFNVGDTATVHIKLNRDIRADEKLYVSIGGKQIAFQGPSNDSNIGTYRVLNSYGSVPFYINNSTDFLSTTYNPSGDPFIDTLTLILNP